MTDDSLNQPISRAVLVQLSDIHLKDDARNAVLGRAQAIVNAVGSCAFGPGKDLFIILSGDLAFKGSEKEYEIATDFLEDLRGRFEGTNDYGQVHWVIVPGNHDCVLPGEDEARHTLADKVIKEQVYSNSILESCLHAQDNYFAFVGRYFSLSFSKPYEKLYQFQVFDVGGQKLGFHLFNTAWLSRRGEQPGQLAVPIDELDVMSNGCDIAIGVLHHPDNWLDPHYNRRAVRRRLENVADLVFTGHEHDATEYQKLSASNEITYFEGGVLQDNYNARNSSFNVMVLNMDAKTYQSFLFTFHDDHYRTRDDNPPTTPLKQKAIRGTVDFVLRPDFTEQLGKGSVAMAVDNGQELRLTDYYIFPDLRESRQPDASQVKALQNSVGKGPQQEQGTIRGEGVVDMLAATDRVMVNGDRRSGKSALASTATLELVDRGLIPILINGNQIRSSNSQLLRRALKDAYDQMYTRPEFQMFLQQPKQMRVLVVDDFDAIRLGHTQLNAVLTELHDIFGKTMLMTQGGVPLSFPLEDGEIKPALAGYKHYEIATFGKALSLALIRKYLEATSNPLVGLTNQELVRRVNELQKTVGVVLRNNFLPAYPIFILLVLQHRQMQPSQGITNASYGYLLEVVIKYNIANSFQSSERYDTAKQFLSDLAMHMHRTGKQELGEKEFSEVMKHYKQEYDNNIREESFTQDLLRSLILEKADDSYRFRFLFQYFYFTASYLADTLDISETLEKVTELSEHLEVKENSEIMVFLSHLSRAPLIMEVVLAAAHGTLADFQPASFAQDIERLEQAVEKVPKVVREAFNAMKNREELARHEDEEAPPPVSTSRPTLDRDEVASELDVAFNILEVLGQILRSRAGSLRAHQKEALVEAAYGLGRRGMTSILDLLQSYIAHLRSDEFRQSLEEHASDMTTEQLNSLIRSTTHVMSMVAQAMALVFIKRVSTAMGSEMIGNTYSVLKERHDNLVVDLLDLAIKLDLYQDSFPFTELEAVARRTHDTKYSRSVLQMLVFSHLRMFDHDRPTIQRALATVGLQIEEHKTLVKR